MGRLLQQFLEEAQYTFLLSEETSKAILPVCEINSVNFKVIYNPQVQRTNMFLTASIFQAVKHNSPVSFPFEFPIRSKWLKIV